MNIDSIRNGMVLDHIQAGESMEIYTLLQPGRAGLLRGHHQKRPAATELGKKDIIKIDCPHGRGSGRAGLYRPGHHRVNIIKDGVQVEKKHPQLPKKLVNVHALQEPSLHHHHRAPSARRVCAERPGEAHLSLRLLRQRVPPLKCLKRSAVF